METIKYNLDYTYKTDLTLPISKNEYFNNSNNIKSEFDICYLNKDSITYSDFIENLNLN